MKYQNFSEKVTAAFPVRYVAMNWKDYNWRRSSGRWCQWKLSPNVAHSIQIRSASPQGRSTLTVACSCVGFLTSGTNSPIYLS